MALGKKLAVVLSLLLLVSNSLVCEAKSSVPVLKGLSYQFYSSSCPKLESIIQQELNKIFKKDITQAASLLRVHFHDCFVQVFVFAIKGILNCIEMIL